LIRYFILTILTTKLKLFLSHPTSRGASVQSLSLANNGLARLNRVFA